jgi:glycerol-3-phosphate acyltransferase PlsY
MQTQLRPTHNPLIGHPISPTLWPRRLFHLMVGTSIPLSILYLAESLVLWGLITLSLLAVLAEVGRAIFSSVNDFLLRLLPVFKPSERHLVTGATHMLLGATLVFLLFDQVIAVLAMLFLAAGDPMAALVGGRAHRGRLFGKSMAGSTAFVIAASGAGIMATLHSAIPLAWWLVPGVVVAAVAELLPLRLDDNVTVPLAAGAALHLMALV